MQSKPTAKRELKNQQKLNEKPEAVAVSKTITLREAALELNKKAPLKQGKVETRRLLTGLQEGALASGFFVTDDSLTWVAIPPKYWMSVTAKQFQVIKSNVKLASAYLVSPADFAGLYARARVESARNLSIDPAWVTSALEESLTHAADEFEVRLLKNAAWDEYLIAMYDRLLASGSLASAKKGGAKEKPGWKLLYRTLTARLIAENIKSREELGVLKKFAADVMKEALALNENKIQLPGYDAFEDEIAELFVLAARPRET
jgi:hypothetical protein